MDDGKRSVNTEVSSSEGESNDLGQPEDRVTVSDPAAQTEALAAQRDKLAAENAELQDLLLRRQADYENFRKRAERERLETNEYASMLATQRLLPILDDFERALKGVPDGEGAALEYAKGMELIYQRLLDELVKLGLDPIQAKGRPFDPNLHNAIQKEEREDVDDQTVIEEFQRGYNFKGRLLRPAMVKVAVKP